MTKTELIYGIAYGCPLMNRCKGCLLFEIENLSFEEKINWIDGLEEKSKEDILNYHSDCSKQRCINNSSEGNDKT